jgi:magnesium-transporting ATPase (P-type)
MSYSYDFNIYCSDTTPSFAKHYNYRSKHKDEIWVVAKGADVVLQKKLSNKCPQKNTLTDSVAEYTTEGHRVLVWAAKRISVDEYQQWLSTSRFQAAATTGPLSSSGGIVSENVITEQAWEEIEKDLFCAGFTVVSDKLQDGVANVITYAKNCGITVVMATGDSVDTAEAIWRKLKQIPDGSKVERLIVSETVKNGEFQKEAVLEKLDMYARVLVAYYSHLEALA